MMESPNQALPDDTVALKALVHGLRDELVKLASSNRAYEALVEALRIQIARLNRQKFGPSSEKISRDIEQLELALEGLEIESAAADTSAEEPEVDVQPGARPTPRRQGGIVCRGEVVREQMTLDPGASCPQCGGELRLVGEDVSKILDFIQARLKLIETRRPKKSCRRCEAMVQSPAPSRPVRRGMCGPGLMSHILVSKFDDQLPLYRQVEIIARLGVDIPRSTLIDWCGQGVAVLRPLTALIKKHVFESTRLHADDTPIRVLDPHVAIASMGARRAVKEGRIWSMSATTRRSAATIRRPPPITFRPIARASIHNRIYRALPAFCRPMPIPASDSFMSPTPQPGSPASGRRPAGPIGAATFTISGRAQVRASPGKRSTASGGSTISNASSRVSPPMPARRGASKTANPWSTPSSSGASSNSPVCPASPIWPGRSATGSIAGAPSPCSWKMAAWP